MKWRPRWPRWPKIPLLARLVITLALVAVLPFGISLYQLESNKESLLDQVLRTHLVASSGTADRIASYLEGLQAEAYSLAGNTVLTADPRSEGGQELLRATLASRGEIAAVGLFDPSGEPVVLAQRIDLRDEIQTALETGDPRAMAVVQGTERRWLRLRREIAGSQGMLLLVADAEPLAAMLEPTALGEETDLALVDPDDGVLFGTPKELDRIPPEVLAAATSGKLGSGASKYRGGLGGETVVGHQQVAGTPFVVLSSQSAEVAEVAQRRIRRTTALAIVATLLLAAGLTAAAQVSVVRPIQRLVRAQRELAGLDSEGESARGSEIDQLESAFAALEARLKESAELDRIFLGRYQVIEVAGSGSMGTVFRGWDPRLERPVALKTIRLDREMVDREKLARRLRSEAVTSARFNHPHIVTVYDMLMSPGGACIAMEFVEGITLETYLERHGRLPPEQVIPLGAAIARALESAHENGLVHQDVKPANVLLSREGEIKVTDFGISRLVSSAAVAHDVICGTPGYLPPESLRGEGFSPQGDLFSLGVLLYECLDGRHPFAGANLREMMVLTLGKEPEAISRRRPGVPPELAGLISRLIAKEPDERPDSAREVVERLEALALASGLVWSFESPAQAETRRGGPSSAPTLLVSLDEPAPRTLAPRSETPGHS